ncbi:lipopolysaccharide biosynthesis protein [Pseudomonas sp. DCB_CB]|uniref:lipopolysaccharide biosynthesis protein n=1 Tax=unclassified Pseudomonas TaxID=196821 RepID=UPI002248DD5D|nr:MULTISPECIES: lipopolysaccharide biosynthesis protein [unclassified Pseudomonas]MCX2691889.1 lipopolysaccharide biosynthesis protein [Pseudomonas sp. DCB_BZ]MCX2857230.1 lipopolysaccharide biosynthesis protein [Pseudomonas sp. DCB_CB]
MEMAIANQEGTSPRVKNFESCRKIAQGPVFIIASGKSAKDFPLEQFSDIPIITMNGAIAMFAGSDIKPFFYVCSDTSFRLQQPHLYEMAIQRSKRIAIWKTEAEKLAKPPSGEIFFLEKAPELPLMQAIFKRESHHARSWALWSKRGRSIGFSKNMEYGYFDARTIAYVALQIAYHLGFSKVFLVGVDLNQSAGRFYENGASVISPCGLDKHFEQRILPSLKLMSSDVVNEEFKVYNLSPTSRIPKSIIPKLSISQAREMIDTDLTSASKQIL